MALEDTDRVVEPLHQTEADRVLRLTVRGGAVPVAVDHRRLKAPVMLRSKTRGSPSNPEHVLVNTIIRMSRSIEPHRCA